ncbi:MAG: hypothetical protein KDA57_10350 [Planctomycetales bacterium]|nr:hypothetical protein [Planctomycetales bacterium]
MIANSPHFLLFSEASRQPHSAQSWRFVLQNVETNRRFCATDTESTDCGERLELLAVVRGLEALDAPSRVTLVTKSRYVSRGIKSGLPEWRRNDWRWERFGRMVPVRDHDLWQRVDRALRFHQLDCQAWHFDSAGEGLGEFSESSDEIAAPASMQNKRFARIACTTRNGAVAKKHVCESAQASAKPKLVDHFRERIHRVGHLPHALKALAGPMRQALGAPG